MKLTIRKDKKMSSITTQHAILMRALNLLSGRYGALETEKEIYLMLAIIDALCEEDVIDECNKDERELYQIVSEDIEPFFNEIISDEKNLEVYSKLRRILLNKCKDEWDDQHSVIGVIDSLLTAINSMSDEDKKEVLTETGKMAEKAYNNRTEMLEKSEKANNSKLEELVNRYQRAQAKAQEEGKESDIK